MCVSVWRRKAPSGEKSKSKRTGTMPLWSPSSNHTSINTILRMVRLTTLTPFSTSTFACLDPAARISDKVELSIAIKIRLEKAFDSLRSRRSTLYLFPFVTREQMVVFLEKTQGETRVEHVLPQEKEKYTLPEFVETWWKYYGLDAVGPLKHDDDFLEHPITNYFISSSHNTYLDGNQIASKSSPETYRTVLRRGCRCIEIDVWNGENSIRGHESTRVEHSRSLSGTTFPNAVASVWETVEVIFPDLNRHGNGHSRNASNASRSLNLRDSVTLLAPGESTESLGNALHSQCSGKNRVPYPKDEPIVTHGWTLTAPCGFREVCRAVRESAFETSELPIIVSLEVHADKEQQEVMVKIMKQEWEGMLVDKPWQAIDPTFQLPTLGQLKRKILVKVKKAPKRKGVPPSMTTLSHIFAPDDDDASSSDDEGNNSAKAICPALGSLAIYTHSEHFESFETPAAKKPGHIFSINERKILELHETKADEMFNHNRNFFMRAYPGGKRVDSSNPDPSLFWRKGVQMVALNWQYPDESTMLNEGMFADEKGWVLKPVGYRKPAQNGGRKLAQNDQVGPAPQGDLELAVTIFAGQHIWAASDSDSNSSRAKHLRPFVRCELHVEIGAVDGKAADKDDFKLSTESARTDKPQWDDGAQLKFPKVSKVVEGLSFLRFEVENDNRVTRITRGELLSWACIRLDRLRPGYRFIQLMDTKSRPIEDGKLLVKIDKVVCEKQTNESHVPARSRECTSRIYDRIMKRS